MKRILAVLVMMLVCFTACEAAGPKQHIILNEPFEVHKAGAKIATEVHVKKAHHYWFELIFLHNKADDEAERERVKKLVGSWEKNKDGMSIEPGIPIPLKITISVIDAAGEHPVTEKEVFVGSVWAGGAGGYRRAIGAIEIPAGHCRITVQSMKDIPELANRKVNLGIRYRMQAKY